MIVTGRGPEEVTEFAMLAAEVAGCVMILEATHALLPEVAPSRRRSQCGKKGRADMFDPTAICQPVRPEYCVVLVLLAGLAAERAEGYRQHRPLV